MDVPVQEMGYLKRVATLVRLARRAFGRYRWQLVVLVFLGFVSGVLEGIGINAFIPLLSTVLGLGNETTDLISSYIAQFFAFIHVPFVPRYLLLFIVLLFIGKAIVGTLLDYIRVRINADYERETRDRLFASQLRSSWPHLLRQRLGHLETLILVDVSASKEVLARITISIMYITNLAMYFTVVFNVSPMITLLTIAVGLSSVFVFRPIASRIHGLAKRRAAMQHEMTHHVSEHLSGIKSVKTFGVQEPAIARGRRFFTDLKFITISIDMLRVFAVALVPPFAVLYVAAIFGLAFKFQLVAVAALPTIVYIIYRIFSYMQQLQDSLQMINGSLPYLRNVITYEDRARERKEAARGDAPFIFSEAMRFKNVGFAYETGGEVLRDVSFEIPRGSMLGIIGPSGAGKTTCVDLLLRLLEPTSGSIMLDDVDSRDVVLGEWRQNIAYVPQEHFLIHDSIRNNIKFYDDAITDEDVWEAARLAHIDGFIRSRPEGLDTQVGERGIQLSAGQRQRIAIARALARKPQVLILDEATSALDAESEQHIQRMLQELKGKLTMVVIAHRLSTIMHSDNLVVLQDGKVVEEGAPEALLRNKDSYFFRASSVV